MINSTICGLKKNTVTKAPTSIKRIKIIRINTQSIFGGMGILEADNGDMVVAVLINDDPETEGSIVSLTVQSN